MCRKLLWWNGNKNMNLIKNQEQKNNNTRACLSCSSHIKRITLWYPSFFFETTGRKLHIVRNESRVQSRGFPLKKPKPKWRFTFFSHVTLTNHKELHRLWLKNQGFCHYKVRCLNRNAQRKNTFLRFKIYRDGFSGQIFKMYQRYNISLVFFFS